MRRFSVAVALVALAACRREAPPPTQTAAAPAVGATPAARPATAPAVPKFNRSTPEKCAGDGSYAQAVECFRSTAALEFSIEETKGVRAKGGMTRNTPGAEREEFDLNGSGPTDGRWSAASTASGVVWTRGGKRVSNEPPIVDRIWQRTVMYIDPQKKEGEPQRVGVDSAGGEECVRYRFTDANSGDVHDVWVSTRDGHIVRVQVESHGVFPSYTMDVTKAGK